MSAPMARPGRRKAAMIAAPILVAAALLWQHLPDSLDIYGPFDVHGDFGTATTGRALAVTVDDVALASEVFGAARLSAGPAVGAAGRWVVVSATVSATRESVLPSVALRVGANTYRPSDRFYAYTLGERVEPGISQHGTWVFDVPPALFDPPGADPFALVVWPGLDERLDDRLVINLRGHLQSRTATVALTAPEVTG